MIDRSKRIIRLANDAYTYEADVASGKMSAMTLRLQAMGAPLSGQDSQQVPRARRRTTCVTWSPPPSTARRR